TNAKKSNAKRQLRADESGRQSSVSATAAVVISGSVPTVERPYLIERLLTPGEVAAEYAVRQAELDEQFEVARKALKRWLPTLKRTPMYKNGDITGACVRYRTRFGRPVSPLQVVIGVNVLTKLRPEDVPAGQMLPRCIDKVPKSAGTVPVKVVEGNFQLIAKKASFLRSSGTSPGNALPLTEPVVGGAAICPPGNPQAFGTVGVLFSSDGTSYFGLTCQHVVRKESNLVDQRGPDLNGNPVTRLLASVKLEKFRHWKHSKTGRMETIDSGLIEVDTATPVVPPVAAPPSGEYWIRGITHNMNQPPQSATAIPLYFSSIPVRNAFVAFDMYKLGAGRGELVIGKLRDSDTAFFNVGQVRFENNFTVEHRDANQRFVTPGDSGSIIAIRAKVDNRLAFVAVGILFATLEVNGFVGLACNMSQVLDALKPAVEESRIIAIWDLP
ncbi:MAG: hypothetical protein O2856_13265, partial [Planctomycetota bacterium]|nr:hypothetical protein [Planctomycetota bacterium]